jgi:hypothetical protein
VFYEDWLTIRFAGFNQETKNHRQRENHQNTPLHVVSRQKNRRRGCLLDQGRN